MTVGRYAGTPIDQLPTGYLRWMLTQDFPAEWQAIAHRKVKASLHSTEYIQVSRHAIDTFSVRFLDRWLDNRNDDSPANANVPIEGLGTFIARKALEAWEKGVDVSKHRHQHDGTVKEFKGIKWVFAVSKRFPDMKDVVTVMEA